MDLSVKTGFLSGTLTNRSNPAGFDFGGFPIVIGYNLDLSSNWSLAAAMSFILDPANFSITRSGVDLVALYHLLGGARRVIRTYGGIEVANRNAYNVSL